VLGLGYIGLPLAIEFSKFYDVVGFDLIRLFEASETNMRL